MFLRQPTTVVVRAEFTLVQYTVEYWIKQPNIDEKRNATQNRGLPQSGECRLSSVPWVSSSRKTMITGVEYNVLWNRMPYEYRQRQECTYRDRGTQGKDNSAIDLAVDQKPSAKDCLTGGYC